MRPYYAKECSCGIEAQTEDDNMKDGETMVAKPFVKWVGGKGQLLAQYDALLPKGLSKYDDLTYVEPFVGGGAMLFHVLSRFPAIQRAVINDINRNLIATYQSVKEAPLELIASLADLQEQYRSCKSDAERCKMFLAKRDIYNSGLCRKIETASLFIFLNRTCFNGLYRVNGKGKYNVSFGKHINPLICDEATILADSVLLRKVEIRSGDFEEAFNGVAGRAFAYLDPPYRPLTQTASFTEYSKEGFSDSEQCRLAKLCVDLDKKGFLWLMSNSDPHNVDIEDNFFDNLYDGFEIKRVFANRMINSNASCRGKITELAIRNYKE